MSNPNIFITEIFLEIFSKIINKPIENTFEGFLDNTNKRNTYESYSRIINLIMSSNIYSDISHDKITDQSNQLYNIIRKGAIAGKNFNYIKIESLSDYKNIGFSDFSYFINESKETCDLLSSKYGRIYISSELEEISFYLNQTFAPELTDEKIHQISKIKHPCSSLVIIDRYLFTDESTKKIDNLIIFLKELIPEQLAEKFEVDIITEYVIDKRGRSISQGAIESRFNMILEAFDNNLSLHLYMPNPPKNHNNKHEHDRYLITNYGIFALGITFDRETNVSYNFFPSNINQEKIKNAFLIWKNKIDYSKKIIDSTPENIALIKHVWKSDDIEHSIFKSI